MATLEDRTFNLFYEKLARIMQHSIHALTSEAHSAFLLTALQQQQCLKDNLSNYEKAVTFLQIIGNEVAVEASVLGDFIEILKTDITLSDLVKEMGKMA